MIKFYFKFFPKLKRFSISYPQGRAMSLDQCLQHFISSETIQEVECENCTKVQSLQLFYSAVLILGLLILYN